MQDFSAWVLRDELNVQKNQSWRCFEKLKGFEYSQSKAFRKALKEPVLRRLQDIVSQVEPREWRWSIDYYTTIFDRPRTRLTEEKEQLTTTMATGAIGVSFWRQRPSKMIFKTVFVCFDNILKQNCKKLNVPFLNSRYVKMQDLNTNTNLVDY